VRFWDSSAVIPLLVAEASTEVVRATFLADPEVISWWATEVECVSALAGLEREGALDAGETTTAIHRLDDLSAAWHVIQPSALVLRNAIRLLRSHPLRSADALQLAAAIAGSEQDASTLPFVTLDGRLADVASREGFEVVRPGE
jgi:predicted nucleic acid-binding protein